MMLAAKLLKAKKVNGESVEQQYTDNVGLEEETGLYCSL